VTPFVFLPTDDSQHFLDGQGGSAVVELIAMPEIASPAVRVPELASWSLCLPVLDL